MRADDNERGRCLRPLAFECAGALLRRLLVPFAVRLLSEDCPLVSGTLASCPVAVLTSEVAGAACSSV